jgi:hypothetical protein
MQLAIVCRVRLMHFRKWCRPKPQLPSGFFLKKNPHPRLSTVHSISENAVDRFQNSCALLRGVKGGIYFHPTDEDLSVGTPVPPHRRRPVCGDPGSTPQTKTCLWGPRLRKMPLSSSGSRVEQFWNRYSQKTGGRGAFFRTKPTNWLPF